jgi:arylsulfatase A-like enzyme
MRKLWGLLALLLLAACPQLRAQGSSPNILFLFLDDMRWDAAGFTGNNVITTPNMDTLAAQGTIFENAFTTTAICMVSRASVFMGQHMARHGITAFNQNLSSTKWADSYPDRLDDAGYYLGFIGKHGLGNGFTGLYGTYDFDKGWNGQGVYFNQTIDGESASGRHLSKFVGDLAIEFIGDVVNPTKNPSGAPFCLQISWKEPHVQDPNEFLPDPAYDALYAGDTIPHAKTDTQAQFDGNLSIFQGGEGTSRWNARFGTEQKFQDNIKKHHRLIHGVDVQIGRILAALDDPNGDSNTSDSLVSNTIIILSSDHGFFLGERHQAGKWYIQEESIRVPMVVMDPRLPAAQKGKRVPQMVLNIDIAATILDYAGVAIPSVMQGRSMKPIVDGSPPADWRTAFLHDHPAVGGGVYRSEGVRTESFSYARYPNNGSVKQLYDVTVDPYQRTNLAGDPRYASKLAELDGLTTQLKADAQ